MNDGRRLIHIPVPIHNAMTAVAIATNRSFQFHADEAMASALKLDLFPWALRTISRVNQKGIAKTALMDAALYQEVKMRAAELGISSKDYIIGAFYLHCLCLRSVLQPDR